MDERDNAPVGGTSIQTTNQSGGINISGGNNRISGNIAGGNQSNGSTTFDQIGDQIDGLFEPLTWTIDHAPQQQSQREAAGQQAQELKEEVAKGEKADDSRMAKLIDGIVNLVPEAVGAVAQIFFNPILGAIAGPVTRFVLDQLQGKNSESKK